MITPEQFADCANESGLDNRHDFAIKKFLRDASAKDIQRFIHQLNTVGNPPFFQFARTALDIRLAEDAEKTSRRIVRLTWGLIILTCGLLVLTWELYKDAHKKSQSDQLQSHSSSQQP
jgi:hypothetical protein